LTAGLPLGDVSNNLNLPILKYPAGGSLGAGLRGRVRIPRAVEATVMPPGRARQGRPDFDDGAVGRFGVDPPGAMH
jgi:hypothetical protein